MPEIPGTSLKERAEHSEAGSEFRLQAVFARSRLKAELQARVSKRVLRRRKAPAKRNAGLVFALTVLTATTTASAAALSATFTNPIVARGADPWVIRWQGSYCLSQSRFGSLWVIKARRLQDLGHGHAVKVWTPPEGMPYSRELWAPELHFLRGKWYLYFAADDGDNVHHRMYVLEGQSADPQGAYEFKGMIIATPDRWAIDGTVLRMSDDRLYFVWSGWEGTNNVGQNLYIAPMSNPWTISGERVCLSEPEHPWEKIGNPWVNEGPEVLWNSNRLFLIYSASGSWDDDYCLGQLTWTGGDVLQRSSWVKKPEPVFSRAAEVFGPGHCSFAKSPDGREDWIIYHAARRSHGGWDRSIRMQRFTWHPDGSPNFGTPIANGVPQAVPGE